MVGWRWMKDVRFRYLAKLWMEVRIGFCCRCSKEHHCFARLLLGISKYFENELWLSKDMNMWVLFEADRPKDVLQIGIKGTVTGLFMASKHFPVKSGFLQRYVSSWASAPFTNQTVIGRELCLENFVVFLGASWLKSNIPCTYKVPITGCKKASKPSNYIIQIVN